MARRYAGKVQFLGVDILDHRGPAREFIEAHGWTFPSVFDPERTIPDGLGLVGQPHTVIFDASGRQVFVWSGAVSEDVLERELARVAGG
jgi:peroxiredoxin